MRPRSREERLAGGRWLPPSLWPTREQDLLLRVAFSNDDEGRAAWEAVRGFDLDRLEPGSFALMPLVYRRLEGWADADPAIPLLKGIYRRSWYRNQQLLREAGQLVTRLRAAGTELLLAGAISVVLSAYRDVGARPAGRVDVLVPPKDFDLAVDVLARDLKLKGPVRASAHRRAVWLEGPDRMFVVVRRNLFGEPDAEAAKRWDGAASLAVGNVTALGLDPSWQLLQVCAGEDRHYSWQRAIWLADLRALLDGPVDWDAVLEHADVLGLTLPLRDSLVCAAQIYDGPVPSDVLGGLTHRRVSRRERFAQRVSRWDWRPLGAFPRTVARYLHATAEEPVPRVVRGFVSYLRRTWGVEHAPAAIGLALRKAVDGTVGREG
jgi:hypothetical protein